MPSSAPLAQCLPARNCCNAPTTRSGVDGWRTLSATRGGRPVSHLTSSAAQPRQCGRSWHKKSNSVAEQLAQRDANTTSPSSAHPQPCSKPMVEGETPQHAPRDAQDQWWSERLRRTFSATLVVTGQLVRLTSSASRHPAMCTQLAREKQSRSKTTGATSGNLHNASGGGDDGRTFSATPVGAGQLAHLTGSASQHPAAWKLLAHEPQLWSRSTAATCCAFHSAFKRTTAAMLKRPVVK